MSPKSPTVLIATDDSETLEAVIPRFQAMGLHVVVVSDCISAVARASNHAPVFACIDVDISNGRGNAVVDMLRSDEQFSAVPIVMLTGEIEQDGGQRHQPPTYYVAKSGECWSGIEPIVGEHLNVVAESNDASAKRTTPDISKREFSKTTPNDPSATRQFSIDPRHSTEDLLDIVFSLMGEDPTMLSDVMPSSKPWVLCIDDDYEFSNILSRRLEALNIGVINAYDGMEGIKTAYSCPANAIILDYNMPNGCGDEVLSRLKQSAATRDIPVIVLTGNKDNRVRQAMMNLGADAFLYKPPQFDALVDELSRYVDVSEDGDSGLLAATC